MAKGFARYGLASTQRPFKPAIDPLSREKTASLFAKSLGSALSERVDACIDSALNESKPALFLVTGASGTGRTSVTNFILSRYSSKIGVDAKNLIIPNGGTVNHDILFVYRNWLKALEDGIAEKFIPLNDRLAAKLDSEILRNDAGTMAPGFRGILRQLAQVLKSHQQPHAYACRLDNVPTIDFFTAAHEIFAGIPTLCVFTAVDNASHQVAVIQPFRQHFAEEQCCLIELERFKGASVASVVAARWEVESTAPIPFGTNGLTNGFDDIERPIGRILRLVEQMLLFKTTRYGEGPIFPASPELAFGDDEVAALRVAMDVQND